MIPPARLVAAPLIAALIVDLQGAAQAHEIGHAITDCRCDAACYTGEVSGAACARGDVSFRANGLPAPDHALMLGITATNQQFPVPHDYTHSFPLIPRPAATPIPTEPGPIGVAVNGIPIFDPSTQGPVQATTGKPVSAAEAGELDTCGGHAGRGDDYHYHIAPKCLIDQLGAKAVEEVRRPIGFANDGYPILALGWFDPAARIEDKLDPCRGATDVEGRYFYNVQPEGDFAVLNCFSGTPTGRSGDKTAMRPSPEGGDYTGLPIRFRITEATRGTGTCHSMTGLLSDRNVLTGPGNSVSVDQVAGTLFYCSSSCYGHFAEAQGAGQRGRAIYFRRDTSGCAADFAPATDNAFLGYWDGASR